MRHFAAEVTAVCDTKDVEVVATLGKELVDAGGYRPVIDRTYRLDEIVEAVRYVETGQKRGNVVLRVSEADAPPAA